MPTYSNGFRAGVSRRLAPVFRGVPYGESALACDPVQFFVRRHKHYIVAGASREGDLYRVYSREILS